MTDVAKLASAWSQNPRTACQNESKHQIAGQSSTPFSLCVSGAATLLKSKATGNANNTSRS